MSSLTTMSDSQTMLPAVSASAPDAPQAPEVSVASDVLQASDAPETPLSGEVFGALINLSGRRRFTSQRLVLYAVLAAQGQADAAAISREALGLFRGAHAALLKRSGDLPGIFCPELEQAYFGNLQGDARITAFAELAGRTLNAIEDKLRNAPSLLQQLIADTTPLLAVLNQITAIYEEQSKRHAREMRKQLHGIMTDIETIAREAKMVAFNARIVAARSGQAGREFSVVASVLSGITGEIDALVRAALEGAAA